MVCHLVYDYFDLQMSNVYSLDSLEVENATDTQHSPELGYSILNSSGADTGKLLINMKVDIRCRTNIYF